MFKNKVLIVFFMFFALVATAQETVNQLDANKKRHGLWKGNHEVSKRPRYEGIFNHGVETGIFKYFDDTKDGKVIATRDFSKNDGSCYVILFDRKGNKVSEGKLVNKVPEGDWKYYHLETKQLMSTEFYKKGKLEGVKKVFYKNGLIAEISNYTNGVLNGKYLKYAENETTLEDSTYKNGELHGKAIFYDGKGNIALKGEYVKGIKRGVWEMYDDGKLVKNEKITNENRNSFSLEKPIEIKMAPLKKESNTTKNKK